MLYGIVFLFWWYLYDTIFSFKAATPCLVKLSEAEGTYMAIYTLPLLINLVVWHGKVLTVIIFRISLTMLQKLPSFHYRLFSNPIQPMQANAKMKTTHHRLHCNKLVKSVRNENIVKRKDLSTCPVTECPTGTRFLPRSGVHSHEAKLYANPNPSRMLHVSDELSIKTDQITDRSEWRRRKGTGPPTTATVHLALKQVSSRPRIPAFREKGVWVARFANYSN